jgi:outer membrane protein TolC
VGKASRSDENNFEFRLKSAEANTVTVRKALRLNYIVLEEILGLEEDVLGTDVELEPLGEEPAALFERPPEGYWLDWALKRRPDLAALSFGVERSEADVMAAAGAWLPSVVLSGQYGWQKFDNMRYSSDFTSAALTLGVVWNVFSGTRRYATLREAQARNDEAVALLRERKLSAFSEVRQAIAEVTEAQDKVAIEKRSRAIAEETRGLVETEYREGAASLTRLNEVQRDFVQAEARYARARILLRQAWSGLRAAAGWRDGDDYNSSSQ